MVGNNTPIFFVRDPLKFTDFIRTQKREPGSHLKPHWRRWDFWSLVPEAIHQVMFLYSDRGTPVSARFMHGYSSHTMSVWNAVGERFWVKWHFRTDQGIRNFTADDANRVAGEDPDYSTRDLYTAIQEKNYPTWTVHMQVMPEANAAQYRWHPFDLTKVWQHGDYPLIEVGRMELNRNPYNFHEEVEQAAFEPGNLVPGISISPDKMLQNRVLSYPDAHRYRIGTNYHQVPVNSAKGVEGNAKTYQRDGLLRSDGNGGNTVDYEPNGFGGPVADKTVAEPPMPTNGDGLKYTWFTCDDTDYYGQPKLFWEKVLDEGRKAASGGEHRRQYGGQPGADHQGDAAALVQGASRLRPARGAGAGHDDEPGRARRRSGASGQWQPDDADGGREPAAGQPLRHPAGNLARTDRDVPVCRELAEHSRSIHPTRADPGVTERPNDGSRTVTQCSEQIESRSTCSLHCVAMQLPRF